MSQWLTVTAADCSITRRADGEPIRARRTRTAGFVVRDHDVIADCALHFAEDPIE